MTTFNYDQWAQEQAEKLRSTINRYSMGGIYDEAVYVIPSNGATPGELYATNQPAEMHEVVRFGVHGSRVSSVPSSQLTRMIWEACRRLPVVPVS